MTAPLRRAHLLIWIVVAIALAIVFAAGLTMRRDPLPPNPGLQWEQLR